MESYVLPVGAKKPTLEELQTEGGIARLQRLAESGEPAARLAAETVGPAASFAPVAEQTSGFAQSEGAESGEGAADVAAGAVYPEPARTMTYEECRNGLGTDKKFFIKSRFAVCSGATFLQTWFRNNRPVGESMFNVRTVGTIAANSREIKFQYYFTEMQSTGQTATAGMKITTNGAMPKSWPTGVKYDHGGNLPKAAKSFDELKLARTYLHTVNAKPGQGSSGSTDLIFTVYEPSISITAPAGWRLGGALSGKLFMLAPRWDAASYLANSTGGGNPAKKGAATFSYLPTLAYSTKAGAPERAVAEHLRTAFTKPGDTKPEMAAKKVPGQAAKEPLHRLVDPKRKEDNRKAAVKQCKRYWGDNYSQGATRECDEYPFATTYEGAAQPDYDGDAKKFNFSVKPVAKQDNGAAGSLLLGFYAKNRLVDGLEDGFLVQITA
ncbi:NucA/NucB deoxyribonuclease domain-containing protein [Streptomyces lavendofoliae]|uniref:NucA/NucB deoxyribonuclease domain-containing protein n=1 Tax=Streptomyces lavendofoliae TaxID=67314 RepID=UPI00300ECE43